MNDRLLVYDRKRTICDCFKYRAKVDNEIFKEKARKVNTLGHDIIGRK